MWMSAASPVPSSTPCPSKISLCTITAPTKSPQRFFSLAVSAQSRQPPRTQNDHAEAGVIGQAIFTASKSNTKHQSSSSLGAKTREQPSSPQDSPRQQRPLSGSDVLWALKRATAEKAKKKRKDVSLTSRPRKSENGEDKAADYSSVRTLTIKSEWTVRLEQLEKRLQQLMDA